MKRLILMRHGDAPRNILEDEERTLSPYGILGVEQTANYIREDYELGHILCSTAKRNKQTLEILLKIIPSTIPVDFCAAIYQNDSEILKSLIVDCNIKTDTLLLLGHNPSLLTMALDCDRNGHNNWFDQINNGFLPGGIIVIEFANATNWEEAIIKGGKILDIFMPQ